MIETIVLLAIAGGIFLYVAASKSSKSSAHVFGNATVSTWEARLLSEARLMELADSPNMQSLLASLSETEYQQQIEGAVKDNFDMVAVERALHEHMAKKFNELLELLPKESKNTIKRFLQKNDLFNLKMIVTMIHQKVPKDQIVKEFIPSSTPIEKLELLASAKDLKELSEYLKDSEYFDAFSGAIPDHEKYGPAPILAALDKRYYSLLWGDVLSKKSKQKVLRSSIGYLIDSTNAKLILRLKAEKVPPHEIDKYVIRPSNELTEPMLKAMIFAENIRDSIHMIHFTTVGGVLKEVSDKVEREGVQAAEKSLDEHYLRASKWLEITQFFSIAPVLSYIAQKENEVKNIRAIMKLKSDGVSPSEIKEIIVRVPKIEL